MDSVGLRGALGLRCISGRRTAMRSGAPRGSRRRIGEGPAGAPEETLPRPLGAKWSEVGALTLALCLLPPALAQAAELVADPDLPGSLVQELGLEFSRRQSDNPFEDLARRSLLFVAGRPRLLSGEQLDAMIGTPETLRVSTAEDVVSFPSRLRMQLIGVLLDDIQSIRPWATRPGGSPEPEMGWSLYDEELTQSLAEETLNTLLLHFSYAELADLAVYHASQLDSFPRSKQGWRRLRGRIVRADLLLGLGAALLLAGTDQASLNLQDWAWKDPATGGRLGWYAWLSNIGISLEPTLRTGLRVAAQGAEFKSGLRLSRDSDVSFGEDPLAVEASWTRRITAAHGRFGGWGLSVVGGGEQWMRHPDPDLEGKLSVYLASFIHHPAWGRSPWLWTVQQSGVLRFEPWDRVALELSLGVHSVAQQLAIFVRGSTTLVGEDPAGQRVGLVLSQQF